ncbi:ubiquinol-cytochrome c reductase complex assembly factor 4 [Salarias fasciatus]|uniref:ubiquinol-cytochrome c reductase complex assembly factor 4 n=1 Tax=Salarias fasciatus TaxID=181472 RepID=UPI001176F0D2|nr:protein CCSMST1 [Salarias fasciatus]
MSVSIGRVFGGVRRAGLFLQSASAAGRTLQNARSLAVTSHMSARSKAPADEEEQQQLDEPIKFSTSKASHRTWRVDRSMGSQYERPWWKVLPISLVFTGFILWCVFRDETDVDSQLEKELYDHIPGLLSDEEEAQLQNKPS